jgi:hypothetical protein
MIGDYAMDVLVVYDSAKLPPEIQKLQDVDQPLPPDVRFFEERYSYSDLAKQFLWGVILMPLGALVLVVSTILLFHIDRHSPSYDSMANTLFTADAVGFIMLVGGFLLLKALWSKYQLIKRQQNGRGTRHGVFLHSDWLIYRSDDSTKVVPKPSFKGLKDRAVQFEHDGATKSFTLPAKLVGKDTQSLDSAIASWVA